jgi:hypothetical protein
MSAKKPTIGTLLEREARGEDLQLRPGDLELFAAVKAVLNFLADADDNPARDFLINFIWVSPLPSRGRKWKDAGLLKEEAAALVWGREQIEELKKDSTTYMTSAAARKRAAGKVLKKYPKLFIANPLKGTQWSLGTVIDALKRLKRYPQR